MRHDEEGTALRENRGRIVNSRNGAVFSPCRTYRYLLWRIWNKSNPRLNFIGLNPSTADENTDDPTMRRCRQFTQDWGFGGFYMTNLFAFRATKPTRLKSAKDPVGPDNDGWIVTAGSMSEKVVFVWGCHGSFRSRNREVIALLGKRGFCISLTKGGHPRHPLYLKKSLQLVEFVS